MSTLDKIRMDSDRLVDGIHRAEGEILVIGKEVRAESASLLVRLGFAHPAKEAKADNATEEKAPTGQADDQSADDATQDAKKK